MNCYALIFTTEYALS